LALVYSRIMVRPERCVLLAGARPDRVSAGGPGSRPQSWEEIPLIRAGRQKSVQRRATKRAAITSERCSLVKVSAERCSRGPSRSCHGESNRQQSSPELRSGTSDREFLRIDAFVVRRLRRWQYRRGGQRSPRRRELPFDWYHGHGLYRLRGTMCYPVQATPVRSSVSRVRENRTHGLRGGS
jgi:hypothetical protein